MRRIAVVALAMVIAGGCKGDETRGRADEARERVERLREEARHEMDKTEAMEAKARADAEAAIQAAAEASAKVAAIQTSLDAAVVERGALVDALGLAQTEADRAAAKAKLDVALKVVGEYERMIADAKAAAARADRMKGVRISKECLDNPLAKGCS